MTATTHLTGKKINRFTHIHQSRDDLIKKVQMLRLISHETASCFQRCVGFDALNALYMTTYEIDEKHGTPYFKRLKKYLKNIQERTSCWSAAMTDPKGDRSKRPSQQADPDLFTHVVKKRDDGVVIRGAKAHQTGAVNSHEIMIMPTQAMRPGDEDYAIVARHPAECPGGDHDLRPADQRGAQSRRGMDAGNLRVRHGRRGGAGGPGRCLRPLGAGLHVRRGGIQPASWWNVLPPSTARITAAARAALPTSSWGPPRWPPSTREPSALLMSGTSWRR